MFFRWTTHSVLHLQVLVSDGGPSPRQSTVWVMVQVLDENDNKPTFPEKVYQVKLPERERRKKGEPIYRVFAYDRDDGPNSDLSYSIVDGNEDGKFFIDPKTAVVSSRKAFSAGSYDILTVCKPPSIFKHVCQSIFKTFVIIWIQSLTLCSTQFRKKLLTHQNKFNWPLKIRIPSWIPSKLRANPSTLCGDDKIGGCKLGISIRKTRPSTLNKTQHKSLDGCCA